MNLMKINCGHCHKEILVFDEYVSEPMFCTLGCMDESEKDEFGINLLQGD
ncbi:MAG: hypothetical protein K0A89_07790 [ANME-2 cluster archaeon]|nr:hypothetical protein [ANME-2 cluster archaeon]